MPPTVVHTYHLPPTPLIPNSPHPLLHYPSLLAPLVTSSTFTPSALLALYASHGWQTQWIARYGPDIQSHYHSTTHEAMTVISGGTATIRFGVADAADWVEGKYAPGERGEEGEEGGVELRAGLGDVFIVPAGVSHKTFSPCPSPSASTLPQETEEQQQQQQQQPQVEKEKLGFWSLGPDEAISDAERGTFFDTNVDIRSAQDKSQFMMMGAYPRGGQWDFCIGGEHSGKEDVVWKVPVPREDPVLGTRREGVVGVWKEGGV